MNLTHALDRVNGSGGGNSQGGNAMQLRGFVIRYFILLSGLLISTALAFGQTLTQGDIAGTVYDQSKAVIANATVNLKNIDTGATQVTKTNGAGEYRFTLLKPGNYQVSVKQSGFAETLIPALVQVGQTTTANIDLSVGRGTEIVEVTGVTPVVNPETSINTSYTQTEIEQLPSAGSDITNIAQTAPGALVNNSGGTGNFTVNGLPATSNLFTVNGENDMDPYFNVNNSGASNLTIGQNEIQEATIVSNAYGGEYGQLSGAQVSYVTKSGTNRFHGNAQYWWNGRYLNANDWFNIQSELESGQPNTRPFANNNQYAASIGGPIIKNKTFFFVDVEGLRFVLPNSDVVTIPSPQFAAAVLANLNAPTVGGSANPGYQPAEIPSYTTMFNLWANAPSAGAAQPVPNSAQCAALTLAGFDPATQSCAESFVSTPSSFGQEWILATRVDQKLGSNDNIYVRYRGDHGLQPSYISPISPNFDANSKQPSWDVQIQETHVLGPRATNSFTGTVSHYIAQFQQNASLATGTFPYGLVTSGTVPFTDFNPIYEFPQGRNITQYQFIDDFTMTRGKHNLKFGANFRRYDVSDHNFFFDSPAVYFGYIDAGLFNFTNGYAYQYRRALNQENDVPVGIWGLGVYASDDWNVTNRLKLTLALRLEHSSNPACQVDCFANFKGTANTLPSFVAAASGADPGVVNYNQDIGYNLHNAFPSVDAIDWSPRIGFSWSPRPDGKTVLSGGFGIFYDLPPAGLLDSLLENPPASVQIRVRPGPSQSNPNAPFGALAFDPGPNGGAALWAASANAFSITSNYNTISTNLSALGSVFEPPSITSVVGKLHAPEWQEWNLSLQQQLTNSTALQINYVGNHGVRIPYENAWANAYDCCGLFPTLGIPEFAPVNEDYGTVTQVKSGAFSSYNGLTASLRHQFSHSFSAHLNYTWSHDLDEVSNGGIFSYNPDDLPLEQNNPYSLKAANYGNADYDVRNSFNADWVYNPDFHTKGALKWAVEGWQLSGKMFWRSGLPFSVVDDNWNGAIFNGNATILAQPILAGANPGQGSCGEGNASFSGTAPSCLDPTAFLNSASATFPGYSTWPTQRRNQYRGPHYFDVDASLFKNFVFSEHLKFAVGLQTFNVLNHPNFANPDAGLGDSTFGQIANLVGTPTSPYGVGLGFDSAPRVVQLTGKFTF